MTFRAYRMFSSVDLYIPFLVGAAAALALCHMRLHKENDCHMTFMYLTPQFIGIEVDGIKNKPEFADYSLILYNEFYNELDPTIPTKHDVPVLFVPGSGGSSKQVRSIASILMNKTEMRNAPFQFKFYAVDFVEELSFLTGRSLNRQREYVMRCIRTIQRIYKAKRIEKKIILLGHSFGGTVIYSLPSHPKYDMNTSDLLIGLAAPLQDPPIYSDSEMLEFYRKMKEAWSRESSGLGNYGMISFSGGIKDYLIPDKLTIADANTIHLPAWSIPDVPCYGADHRCVLWCNQMARHLSRIFYYYAEETIHAPKEMRKSGQELIRNYFEKETSSRLKSAGLRLENKESLERQLSEAPLWPGDGKSYKMIEKYALTKEKLFAAFKVQPHTQYQIFKLKIEMSCRFNLLIYHDNLRFLTRKGSNIRNSGETENAKFIADALVYGFNNDRKGVPSPFYVVISNGLNRTCHFSATLQPEVYALSSLYNFIINNGAELFRNLYLALIVFSMVDVEYLGQRRRSSIELLHQCPSIWTHVVLWIFILESCLQNESEARFIYVAQPLILLIVLYSAEIVFGLIIEARNWLASYIRFSILTATHSIAIDSLILLVSIINPHLACAILAGKLAMFSTNSLRLVLALLCCIPLGVMSLSNTIFFQSYEIINRFSKEILGQADLSTATVVASNFFSAYYFRFLDYELFIPLLVHAFQTLVKPISLLPVRASKMTTESHKLPILIFAFIVIPFFLVYFGILYPILCFFHGSIVNISLMKALPMSVFFVLGITVLLLVTKFKE